MNIVDCGICGNPCIDQDDNGRRYISCCRPCSIKVHDNVRPGSIPRSLLSQTDPKNGDGFPLSGVFANEIEKLKVAILTTTHNNVFKTKPAPNKYIDECPCGIHPSRCDFHR